MNVSYGSMRMTILYGMVMFFVAIPQKSYCEDMKSIAVLYFDNNSVVDKEKIDPLKKGLTDMMITELSKITGITVINRDRIQSLAEELNLNGTDLVDQSMAKKVGKLLGTRFILMGQFSNLFNNKLRIEIRIVAAESGETMKVEDESGESDELLTMVRSLVKKIASDLDIHLSADNEDRLALTQDGNFDAYLSFSKGLIFEDDAKMLEKLGKKAEAMAAFENAGTMFQKAWEESMGYEPAKQKVDEVMMLISKMK